MNNKKLVRALSLALCGAIGMTFMPACSGCNTKKDSISLMTEDPSGLFNPYYATSGPDQDVVGMTQIGMLSTDNQGNPVAGDDLPTVVKAFEYGKQGNKTVYSFVIKNGLKFSDGKPLTMNDVLFNMYEYLDPVYTGSSTMYSIDIEGLATYRTQKNMSGTNVENEISKTASAYARIRRNELYNIYTENARVGASTSTTFSASPAQMESFIDNWEVTSGYKSAVATVNKQATMTISDYRKLLKEDYNLTLTLFKEEIEDDFRAAKESYDVNSLPYSEHKDKLSNDLFKFFLYEGDIKPKYKNVNGKDDKSHIERFEGEEVLNSYSTQEAAINKVYNDKITSELHNVLSYWGTAGNLLTQFTADATEVQIRNNITGDELLFPNISGIKSLGHTTDEVKVTIKGVTYNVAHEHNDDGTPKNADEYDVLQITINGDDPKAIYNFGFTVAPAHYYSADEAHPNGREIDIKSNKFGVDFASSSFQSKTIQSQQHVKIPVGAGAYQATDLNNKDNPTGAEFWNSNILYYKANPNFMFPVKTDKIRLQVQSASNALDVLESGGIDYVVPQFTDANAKRLESMTQKGFAQLASWQLGYGYIGINAGKVKNIGVRKAIMAAMETTLAVEYYKERTCQPINWPMSKVSWAYPKDAQDNNLPNGHDYTQWTSRAAAVANIKKYAAGASKDELKITFTIAGASITEHPTYNVFKQAAEILNEDCADMGWNVEVKADSQALTKLATGSLEVWAAAWGSTIDPDMYQVYHKNSSATSVYAWGYREIKAAPTQYPEETRIINELSVEIDNGRATTDQPTRKTIYQKAMSLVLDLAVELPVYQRQNLYAYNAKTVKGFPETVNEYSSPLEKIWELELVA